MFISNQHRLFNISLFIAGSLTIVSPFAMTKPSDSPKPMTAVDMVEVTRLSNPIESPNGRYVVYLQRETDWSANRHTRRYVLYDNHTQESQFILKREKKGERFSKIAWSPNSKGFLVVLERKSKDKSIARKQIYAYLLANEKLKRITAHETSAFDPKWLPNGSGFFFRAIQKKDKDNNQKLSSAIKAFDEPGARELWHFNMRNAEARKILSGNYTIRNYSVAADGQLILFSRAKTHRRDDRHNAELWSLDLKTLTETQLTDNAHAESSSALSPQSTHFAFIASVNENAEPYYEDNLFVQTVGEKKTNLLFPKQAIEVLDLAWHNNGQSLYFLGNTGLRSQLYSYDLKTSNFSQLTYGDHELTEWSYNPSTGNHVFLIENAQNPGELFRLNPDGEMAQISRVFERFNKQKRLPKQQAFTWEANDKQRLEGLLVYPVDYVPEQTFPLVTITHGGPRTSAQFGSWNDSRYISVLAAQGYGVFLPNHRGGTGYGDDFMRDMVGGYFNNADDDVMSGIDALIKAGLAAPDKLIKQGWSAGGHMTNWLITQTDRFKAASSGAGVSDWVSMYGESDINYMRTFNFGGSPWQKQAPVNIFYQHSPLFQAHNITTPTLFWSGEDDVRVPPTQSILMYRAARANGVETRLYIANDEPHNFKQPSHQLFKINTELAWYARHLNLPDYQPIYPQQDATKDKRKR